MRLRGEKAECCQNDEDETLMHVTDSTHRRGSFDSFSRAALIPNTSSPGEPGDPALEAISFFLDIVLEGKSSNFLQVMYQQ